MSGGHPGIANVGWIGAGRVGNAMVRRLLLSAIAQGHGEQDFLSLLTVQARTAGLELSAEHRHEVGMTDQTEESS
jgi:hypothetical protein